ncbi:MAG TPA: class I SAM-dependent methyltransferase [Chthonomonadaceae bacterium]|nr:class I SAM-dependent methyltransferase [Chthonomonadaceae bacterium]
MPATSYTTVTELPGAGATPEQLSMLCTRYDLARRLCAGKEVLEVACGTGTGLGYIARKARRVVGGDYDPKMVDLARSHYGNRIELHQLDAQNLPFPDKSFDVVLLLEAIYYLPQAERFVAEARRVLRDDGTLFICSANREWNLFNPSPFSHRYYSAGELKELLAEVGFQVKLLAGFPDVRTGLKSKALGGIRKLAVDLHLIPKTMGGKEKLKRLLYGKLVPLPVELGENMAPIEPLVEVDGRQPISDHKVIYAIGSLSRAEGAGA